MSYKTKPQESQQGSPPKVKIPAQILRGVTDQQRDELIYSWVHCNEIRNSLKKVLDKELKSCYDKIEKEDFLTAPNLTERMAYNSGLCSGLKQAMQLLGDDKSND